ncbi:MAG: VWA domain-containing protein, partial [Proteobacteria bacterium]|nr:VWA domain-containing protein [Pseudomonadota bacterium]
IGDEVVDVDNGVNARAIPELDEPPLPVVLLEGEAIVRQCFVNQNEDRRRKPTNKTSSKPMLMPSAPPPPKAEPSPRPDPSTSGAGEGSSAAIGGGRTNDSSVMTTHSGAKKEEAKQSADNIASFAPREHEKRMDMADEEEVAIATPVEQPVVPDMDWGAKIYLSNDDSMSLASAQRVLYAVKKGVRLRTAEIRPHELLNYFSFDTADVPKGELFSVRSTAEQNDDILSVALSVKGATPARQPLDLTVVIDRSGSMSSEGRMDYTKKGLTQMTDSLKHGDRVDIVLFDTSVCTPLEDFVVGRDDNELLVSTIRKLAPRGSTDLDSGLREAYRIQAARKDTDQRNRRVMLITDAQLNTGNVNVDLVSEVGKQFEENNIRLTGIGVGRDFNDKMLDKLTEKGKGAYVYLGSKAVVDRVFGVGFESLTQTIAHDVRFSLQLPDSLALEKFYGEEASTNPEEVQPINYYAGTSQLFLQDLKIKGGKLKNSDKLLLNVEYNNARTGKSGSQQFKMTVGELLDSDAHNVNKAQTLMAFTDVLLEKSMGGAGCTTALDTYRERADEVKDDAEVAFVNGLLGKMCGVDMNVTLAKGVDFKIRVDSDIPIAEVGLDCAGRKLAEKLSSGDTVATFSARPGECKVRLVGTVEMVTKVTVPATGGDIRCMVRGGRMSCS